MRQLGKLYTESPARRSPESIIPPVGVRNLFLSIGHVDDADLCLRTGFYLSGDLYLDTGPPRQRRAADAELPARRPATTARTSPRQCEADSDCLASVLIDVQTGKGGGIPSLNAPATSRAGTPGR